MALEEAKEEIGLESIREETTSTSQLRRLTKKPGDGKGRSRGRMRNKDSESWQDREFKTYQTTRIQKPMWDILQEDDGRRPTTTSRMMLTSGASQNDEGLQQRKTMRVIGAARTGPTNTSSHRSPTVERWHALN